MPTPSAEALRRLFLIDPEIVFLNHGSFGACPQPVFDVYQHWQRELEHQPVAFLGRRAPELMAEAREALGAYLNTAPDNLTFITNATEGINAIARSLDLGPGDEILTSDHEYGAIDRTWAYIAQRTGAHIVRQTVPLPLVDDDAFTEAIWAGVTPRTRVIALSHITSPTALIFPLDEISRRARAAGILTVIDGAHVPGQMALDLDTLDVDCYSGNLHKWLCAPKGSAFMYVSPELQARIEPPVISWGWNEAGASFVDRGTWQGTRDISPYLSVPAAIEFQAEHAWATVRARCHGLAVDFLRALTERTGIAPLSDEAHFAQMVAVPLPACDMVAVKACLYDEFRVEVPLTGHGEQVLIRVSFQGYNTAADSEALLRALDAIFAW